MPCLWKPINYYLDAKVRLDLNEIINGTEQEIVFEPTIPPCHSDILQCSTGFVNTAKAIIQQ